MKLVTCIFSLAIFSLWMPVLSIANGQETSEPLEENSSKVVYEAEFFAPYNPITAEDMLNRIPGTEGLVGRWGRPEQDERRGLRSNTGQILINGKRITGKENESAGFLDKLPAKSVKQIELITGNVRELDTDVGKRVINVVLKDDVDTGSGFVQGGLFMFRGGEFRPMGNLSYSGGAQNLSYNASFQLRPGLQLVDVTDVITTESGGRLVVIEEKRRREQEQYNARGTLTYSWPAGPTIQVNGLLKYFPRNNQDITTTFSDVGDGPLIQGGTIVDRIGGDDVVWEIGGDYTQAFGKTAKFTGLFIYSNETVDRPSNNFFLLGSNLDPRGGDTKNGRATEKILRGTFDWDFAAKHELELGVEGAINTLDKDLDVFAIVDGVAVDIPITNSDQEITEDRIEAFTTHSWKPMAGLEIETGLAAEFSWLTQLGSDVSAERSLTFVKPSLSVWYNIDDATQAWFSFSRDVRQLDFEEFAATVDREDDDILAGNPELIPEKSWDFEVGMERRFTNGAGVFNGRVFYSRVNDVKDLIPLGALDSQPGNLGGGKHYGVDVEASIRFGRFTPVDAVLSASVLLQDSQVTDAFTGDKRRIGNQPEYILSVEGRHDIKSRGLSYGFAIDKEGPTLESDLSNFDRERTGTNVRIFAEKSLGAGTVMRMFWGNLLRMKSSRSRTLFATTQLNGDIENVAARREKRFSVIGFRLRTAF